MILNFLYCVVKVDLRISLRLVVLASLFFWLPINLKLTQAQVLSDDTTGTLVETADNLNFMVVGGTQAQTNLFHSFQDFSIPQSGSVTFFPSAEVENIFSRITGTGASLIDGTIATQSSQANLFLLNPNGIVFGSGAALNLRGSFVATTAERFLFGADQSFSATNQQSSPALIVRMPTGLQFGSTSGPIVNRSVASDVFGIPIGLAVPSSQTLALIGNGIRLEGGFLSAPGSFPQILLMPGGTIELGSVAANSLVDLEKTEDHLTFGYSQVQAFADILFNQGSAVNASGSPSGDVQLYGRTIELSEIANVGMITYHPVEPGGNLLVNATGLLSLDNSIIGNISLFAANTGNITVNAAEVFLDGASRIDLTWASRNSTPDENNAELVINASQRVEILNLSQLTTQIFFGQGSAGTLVVNTNNLRLLDGGQITSSSRGSAGNAGRIEINARESIEIQGSQAQPLLFPLIDPSGILAVSSSIPTVLGERPGIGDAGSISIQTSRLMVGKGGVISVDTAQNSIGRGGDLSITANQLVLDQGTVSAATQNNTGGNIRLNLRDLLVLKDGGEISTTAGLGQLGGDGGNIDIEAGFVIAQPQENLIQANAFTGNGGNINIRTNALLGSRFVEVSASSEFGLDGSTSLTEELNLENNLDSLPSVPASFPNLVQGCPIPGGEGRFTDRGRSKLPLNLEQRLMLGTIDLPTLPPSLPEAGTWTALRDGSIALVSAHSSSAEQQIFQEGYRWYEQGNFAQAVQVWQQVEQQVGQQTQQQVGQEIQQQTQQQVGQEIQQQTQQQVGQQIQQQTQQQVGQQTWQQTQQQTRQQSPASALGESSSQTLSQILTLQGLALAYQYLGQEQGAADAIETSLASLRALPNPPLELWVQGVRIQANVLQQSRQYDQAIDQLSKSVELLELNSPDSLGITALYLSLGDVEQARYSQRQEQLQRENWPSTRIATLMSARTALDYYQRAIDQASLSHHNLSSLKSLAQLRRLGLLWDQFQWLAEISHAIDSPELKTALPEAESQLRRQQEQVQHDPTTANPDSLEAKLYLTELWLKMSRSDPQFQSLALNLARSALNQAQTENHAYGQAYSWFLLAQLNPTEALRDSQQAVRLTETIQAWDLAYRAQWQLGRVYQKAGNLKQAQIAYEEARKAINYLRYSSNNPQVRRVFSRDFQSLYQELIGLYAMEPTSENLEALLKVNTEGQLHELEDYLNCGVLDPISFYNTENPPAAIVTAIDLEAQNRLQLVVSTPQADGSLHHQSLSLDWREGAAVTQVLKGLVNTPHWQNLDSATILAPAQQLYHLLIEPMQPFLPPEGTIVFVLDRTLQTLPLALLQDPRTGTYLIERYSLAQTSIPYLYQTTPSSRVAVLAAGLSEPREGSALPYVTTELRDLETLVDRTRILLDQDFTQSNLTEAARSNQFNILHLATHGQFSSQPDQTYLQTYDSKIRLSDLSQLLQNRARTELLVLSACDTAKGDDRSVLGIAGIAFQAGAESVLASLRTVNDEATANLMREFYRAWIGGESKAEALRLAQLKTMDRYSHPNFWASFILVGNWH